MFLMPQYMLPDIFALTDDFLDQHQIRGIIFDIDNTLVGFRTVLPTPEVTELLEHLQHKGIKLAIVSNNSRKRVRTFAQDLGIPFYFRSCKPLVFVLWHVRRRLGLPAKQIAMVGDQIYTDMLGGNCAGMITVLVDPIDHKETFLFRLKRKLEMPVIERRKRKDEQQ